MNFNIIISPTPRSSKQSPHFSRFPSKSSIPVQTNLWHSCPRALVRRFPWHAAFIVVPVVDFFCPTIVCILWRIYVHIHIYDRVEFVYELPLLPAFLHKSGAVRRFAWIFVIGVPARRWMGEYTMLDKTIYNITFKQEVVAAPVASTCSSSLRSSRKALFEI
jgi:hypothetical protein